MFSDPLFRFQSYLSGRYEVGYHPLSDRSPVLDIVPVWADYRGRGVTIAVSGAVDPDHPDLAANYRRETLTDYDPRPDLAATGAYPTFLAGIAAADDNDIGLVGVAPDAGVVSYRPGRFTPEADIRLTLPFGQILSPVERGQVFDADGRGGLGTVTITMGQGDTILRSAEIATGATNGMFGLNALREVITTAGLTSYGLDHNQPGTDFDGPMLLVTAPIFTSSYLDPGGSIPPGTDYTYPGPFGSPAAFSDVATTLGLDISGAQGVNSSGDSVGDLWEVLVESRLLEAGAIPSADYATDFSGNAAVGVVGGAVALMLEANPALGWRDVQSILALSADPFATAARPGGDIPERLDPFVENGATSWNAGGLMHSETFGFGALDIRAAVRLAETWSGSRTSANEVSAIAELQGPLGEISLDNDQVGGGLFRDIDEGPEVIQWTADSPRPLGIEHVSLEVDLTTRQREQAFSLTSSPASKLTFDVISPSGRVGTMTQPLRFAEDPVNGRDTLDFTFTSRVFWGERAEAGAWRIELRNDDSTAHIVDVEGLRLLFHGSDDVVQTHVFTDAFAALADLGREMTIGSGAVNAAAVTRDLELVGGPGGRATAGGQTLYEVNEGATVTTLIAGDGNDRLVGTIHDDILGGMRGSDTLLGGAGDDLIVGGATSADLRDIVFGGDGDDTIDGGYGNDELRGDAGNDEIAGGFGADTVIGGAGNDTLTGSAFGDLMFGGDGMDFVNGGFGSDRVNGGAGADRFFHLGIADHGNDWIQDYGSDDVLVYGGAASATADQFQVNRANTANAGDASVDEAFVIYKPTGQILWALVDGFDGDGITLRLGSGDVDLLA